mgnify:CR=1 FL=1
MEKARLSGVLTLIFGLLVGCKASMNANAHVNGQGASAEADADLKAASEGKGDMVRLSSPPAGMMNASASVGPSSVLLGARHDLKLRAGQSTAACQCLAVALGGAHGAPMLWTGAAPDIDETRQLSIALSSEGQTCKDEPKGSLGASYWGYRISGNDVIVLVEAARGGRPLTSGAVIPKPVGPGQVYVAPASKKLPYGRAADGNGMCKIGNPGQPRSAGFTDLELGTNASESEATKGGPGQEQMTTIELPAN